MKNGFGIFTAVLCGIVFSVSAVFAVPAASAAQVTIDSPQGSVHARLTVDETMTLDLDFGGKRVLTGSELGLVFKEGAYGPLAVTMTETRQINNTWENRFGRNRFVKDRAAEVTVHCTEKTAPNRKIAVILRAYDDGFAFRYAVKGEQNQNYCLTEEKTAFKFDSNLTCWATNNQHLDSSHEAPFDKTRLSELLPEGIYGLPLVAAGDFGYVALAEAQVTNWPKAHFKTCLGENAVKIGLTPRKDGNGTAAGPLPLETPWRVVLLGKRAIDLVNNSGIMLNLNPPCAVADTGWITPGASSWDWWAHDNEDLSTETFKKRTDFSVEMGWPYTTLDVPWYGMNSLYLKRELPETWYGLESLVMSKDTPIDILSGTEKTDFTEAMRYAEEKGIRVFVWTHQEDLKACGVERAFKFYSEQGVAGLKIDFIEREDQEMVEWTYRVIQLAAKYHLHINFHGVFPPSGICRTYPNFLTQEGVMGNEFSKWTHAVSPVHGLTLPFTRYLLGHADFTPGGFLNRHSEEYQPQGDPAKNDVGQMGTRGYALAQCVLYDSPLLTLCDTPEHYRNQPGIEMLKNLPAVWDESRAIAGEIGEYLVMARRSGEKWYLSGMTSEQARTLDVTLGFLPEGTVWNADIYADAPETENDAEKIAVSRQTFNAGQNITVKMAREGGWNAVLTPAAEN